MLRAWPDSSGLIEQLCYESMSQSGWHATPETPSQDPLQQAASAAASPPLKHLSCSSNQLLGICVMPAECYPRQLLLVTDWYPHCTTHWPPAAHLLDDVVHLL